MAVKYFGGDVDVQLGDRVALRVWFRKRLGRVVYVPGISPFNPEFSFNGLQWVGIRFGNGQLLQTVVLEETGNLKKKVHFLERDPSPCDFITESSREFDEKDSGLAL